MTTDVVEKAMFFITNVYQSNITKSTDRNRLNHTIHAINIPFLLYFLFAGQKVSPLKIALVKLILPKINRRKGWSKNALSGKFLKN